MTKAKRTDRHVSARRADSRDAEVGMRVKSRRLSQTELADAIGITFQQVQKYEKGINRIGASRLQRIAEALEVPVTFFYDGAIEIPARAENGQCESVFALMQTSGSARMLKAFHRIKNPKARQLLVGMTEELADA